MVERSILRLQSGVSLIEDEEDSFDGRMPDAMDDDTGMGRAGCVEDSISSPLLLLLFAFFKNSFSLSLNNSSNCNVTSVAIVERRTESFVSFCGFAAS